MRSRCFSQSRAFLPVTGTALILMTAPATTELRGQETLLGQRSLRERSALMVRSAQRDVIKRGNVENAKVSLHAAAMLDPTYASPLFNLGILALAEEEWDAAKRWFEGFLARDNTSEWA